jgi:hypothetical protein
MRHKTPGFWTCKLERLHKIFKSLALKELDLTPFYDERLERRRLPDKVLLLQSQGGRAAIEAKPHKALRKIAFREKRSLVDVVREVLDGFIRSRTNEHKVARP